MKWYNKFRFSGRRASPRLLATIWLAIATFFASQATGSANGQGIECPSGICPLPYRGGILDPSPVASETESAPHPAVVRVRIGLARGESWGSGVLAAADERIGVVLTAAHVVQGAKDIRACKVVFVAANHTYLGTLLAVDAGDDLAAIAIRTPREADPVKLAASVAPGETVVAAGFGSNTSYRAYRGQVLKFVSFDRGRSQNALDWTGASRQGDSGGPVFNARGELTALISTSGWGTSQGPTCFRIREFLEGIAGGGRQNPPGQTPAIPAPTITVPPFVTEPSPSSGAAAPSGTLLERLEQIRGAIGAATERIDSVRGRVDEVGGRVEGVGQALSGDAKSLGEKIVGVATVAGAARDKIEKVESVVAALHDGSPLDAASLLWPILAGALGLSTPPTAVFVGLKVLGFLARRRWRKRSWATASSNSQAPVRPSGLNDDYAAQLAAVYEYSGGRSAIQDATLGREFDREVENFANSTDPAVAQWARRLRERVHATFQRIHGKSPVPAEPIGP